MSDTPPGSPPPRARPAEIPAPTAPPAQRLPGQPMPPYRFVPGRHPHPIKSPEGHMAGSDGPPRWSPDLPWTEDEGFLRGCDLFDHRFVWEAHEAWEGVWHQVPTDDPYRLLLQGLIQAAAGVLKVHVKHEAGAARLHTRSCEKLRRVMASSGSPYRGLDLAKLIERLEAFHSGGYWPTLPTVNP